jgi:hypothetical protein
LEVFIAFLYENADLLKRPPPGKLSLLDTVDTVGFTGIFGIPKKTRRVGSEIAPAVRPG